MSRKIRKKQKESASNNGAATGLAPKPQGGESQEKNDGRTDFGGLPERDLKKNLGCG